MIVEDTNLFSHKVKRKRYFLSDLFLSEAILRRPRLPNLCVRLKFDEFVKSQKLSDFVIPAEAGIQGNQQLLDSRLRGSDGLGDFLRDHHN